MLFKVEMTVNIPASMPKDQADAIKAEEKAYSQRLQREGKWLHIWRVAGLYANVSIFDVADNQELHDILTGPNGAVPRPVGGADIDGSGFREARPHRPALPVRCTDAATLVRDHGVYSSVVRAPARKAGGRGFDSR